MYRKASSAYVLVTGGAGAIGINLVQRLVVEGYRVVVFSLPGPDLVRLRDLKRQVELVTGDLTDAAVIQDTITRLRPQFVFHLASTIWARPPGVDAARHLQVNGLGTLNLLEVLKLTPHTRFVFTGSAAVYGPGTLLKEDALLVPNTIFGACKATASILVQTYARTYGLSTVELRLFMPYGPWEHPDRLISQTILSALAGRDLPMTSGEQKRDPVYIDDVVDALLLAATKPVKPGAVFNIGAGKAIPVKDIVKQILALMGNPVKPLLGKLPMRTDEIMEMSADVSAARRKLGWLPKTSLVDGLRKTIAWWEQHPEFVERMSMKSQASAVPDPVKK